MPSENLQLPHQVVGTMAEVQDNFETIQTLLPSIPAAGVYPPWHVVGDAGEPAFENDWGNSSARPLHFFRDQMGFVYIAGLVERASGAGVTVFTLPVGYRPPYPYEFVAANGSQWNIAEDGTVDADFAVTNSVAYGIDIPPFRVI